MCPDRVPSTKKSPPPSPPIFSVDRNLQIVKFKDHSRGQKAHSDAIRELLQVIYTHISKQVNYAHIKATVPKAEIPISIRGKYFDISYIDRNNNCILIEVKVIRNPDKSPR